MSSSSEDEEAECHCHDEPWLVSYADLMTLLFGFFVIMYTFAAAKLEKMPESLQEDVIPMRKEIAKYFGGDYVTPLKEVAETFEAALSGLTKDKTSQITITPEGLDVSLQSNVLFESGKATIHPNAFKALMVLAKLVLEEQENYKVIVEGHTDNIPIKTSKYPSNWELSGARASAVVRLFEKQGFTPSALKAVGYGESRPKFPNQDKNGKKIAVNMARNRRIRLKISLLGDGFNPKYKKIFEGNSFQIDE